VRTACHKADRPVFFMDKKGSVVQTRCNAPCGLGIA